MIITALFLASSIVLASCTGCPSTVIPLPYRIYFKQLVSCAPPGSVIKYEYTYNTTADGYVDVLSGTVTTTADYTDAIHIDGALSQYTDGAWHPNKYILRFARGCTDLRIILGTKLFVAFTGAAECPITAGRRPITPVKIHAVLDQSRFPPMFFHGFFNLTLAYKRDHTLIGCLTIIADTCSL